jgi:hypothetical protein
VLYPLFLLAVPERIPLPEELRVRQFYRAAIAPFGKPVASFAPDDKPRVEEPKGPIILRTYRFADGMVFVNPKDGQISGASFSQTSYVQNPRLIRDEQVVKLARKYVRAAGYEAPIDTFNLQDRQGNNSAAVRVDFVPTYRGVAFDRYQAGSVMVNRETGHLEALYAARGPWPKPPARMRPAFGTEEARVRAMASLLKSGVAWVKASPTMPLHLSIVTDPAGKGRGRLVYAMQGYDPRRVYRSSGKPDRFFSTHVDSQSGQARTIHFPILGGEKRRMLPVEIPEAARNWRVGGDAKGLLAGKVEGKVTRSLEFNFRPVRFGYLMDGDQGWRVEVGGDGRFSVREIDERPAYFRASGKLKEALLTLPTY